MARGHEVTVFGYPGGMLEKRMQEVVAFEPILKGMDLSPLAVARASAALRKHRADVVLAMMKKDVRLTVPAARTLGIPSVVRHANDRALKGGLYDRAFFGWLPAHHVVNSFATRTTLLASAPWIDPEKITVVHNGIDPAPFENAKPADLGISDDGFVFGFVGRLEIRKGLIDLAIAWREVAKELPNAWLVITGNGADEVEARAAVGDTPRVKWLGHRSDVPAVLRSLDVLVVPSHWEGFGLIAAEGLAAGVPVIAARASSLPEIISDGVEGRLVPPRDPESLARALIQAARHPAENAAMTAAGRAKIQRDFGVERMIRLYESVLENVAVRG
jgi:glycosyltransferase involved in cell wall biosynthesis